VIWQRLRFVLVGLAVVAGTSVLEWSAPIEDLVRLLGLSIAGVNVALMVVEHLQRMRAKSPRKLMGELAVVAAGVLGDAEEVHDAIRTGILRDSTIDPVAIHGGLPGTIGLRPQWMTDLRETTETDLIIGRTVEALIFCSGSARAVNSFVTLVPLDEVSDFEYETRRMPWGVQGLLGLRFGDGTSIALSVKPPWRLAVSRFLSGAFVEPPERGI